MLRLPDRIPTSQSVSSASSSPAFTTFKSVSRVRPPTSAVRCTPTHSQNSMLDTPISRPASAVGVFMPASRAVADLIKRRAAEVGLDGLFAGHSLRSGFATERYAQALLSSLSCATLAGVCQRDAGLCAGGNHLERQRRCPAGSVNPAGLTQRRHAKTTPRRMGEGTEGL
jgi:hypothetical protein